MIERKIAEIIVNGELNHENKYGNSLEDNKMEKNNQLVPSAYILEQNKMPDSDSELKYRAKSNKGAVIISGSTEAQMLGILAESIRNPASALEHYIKLKNGTSTAETLHIQSERVVDTVPTLVYTRIPQSVIVPPAEPMQIEAPKTPEVSPFERHTAALQRVAEAASTDPQGRVTELMWGSLQAVARYRETHVQLEKERVEGNTQHDEVLLIAGKAAVERFLPGEGNAEAREGLLATIDAIKQRQTVQIPDEERADAATIEKLAPVVIAEGAKWEHVGKVLAAAKDVQERMAEVQARKEMGPESLGLPVGTLVDALSAVRSLSDEEPIPNCLPKQLMEEFLEDQIAKRVQDLADGRMPAKRKKEETKRGIKLRKLKKIKPNEEIQEDGTIRAEYKVPNPHAARAHRDEHTSTVVVVRTPDQKVEVYQVKNENEVVVRPVDGELEALHINAKSGQLVTSVRPADIGELTVNTHRADCWSIVQVEDSDINKVLVGGSNASVSVGKGTIGEFQALYGGKGVIEEGDVLRAELQGHGPGGHGSELEQINGDAGHIIRGGGTAYKNDGGYVFDLQETGAKAASFEDDADAPSLEEGVNTDSLPYLPAHRRL